MLSKLIKYEWNALFKRYAILILTLLLATTLTCVAFFFSAHPDADPTPLLILTISLYYILVIGVPVAGLIIFAVRYYKSCYTDEGYLTNTLPVKSHEIILSKLIVGSLYSFITSIVMYLSIAIVLYTFLNVTDMIEKISAAIPEAQLSLDFSIPSMLLWGLVITILSSASGTMMIIGSISLGSLWNKHKVLGSIVSYAGIYFVLEIIALILILPVSTRLTVHLIESGDMGQFMNGYIGLLMGYSTILSLILSIALYFISNYVLKNKLNME